GKIYHTGHGNKNDRQSWSVPSWKFREEMKDLSPVQRGDTTGLESDFPAIKGNRLPFYCSDAPEEQMSDAVIADVAVERIRTLKDSTFFMAVGFIKPHLPFVAPRKYWDLYDPKTIRIPPAVTPVD